MHLDVFVSVHRENERPRELDGGGGGAVCVSVCMSRGCVHLWGAGLLCLSRGVCLC